jgi:hypothetical protein
MTIGRTIATIAVGLITVMICSVLFIWYFALRRSKATGLEPLMALTVQNPLYWLGVIIVFALVYLASRWLFG